MTFPKLLGTRILEQNGIDGESEMTSYVRNKFAHFVVCTFLKNI